jgi:hypothetical protein
MAYRSKKKAAEPGGFFMVRGTGRVVLRDMRPGSKKKGLIALRTISPKQEESK